MAPRIASRALHARSRWRFVVCDVSCNVYIDEVWLFSFLISSLTYLCGTHCRAEVRRPSMDMASRYSLLTPLYQIAKKTTDDRWLGF